MATSSTHRGWLYDAVNARLGAVYNGTEVFDFDANDMVIIPDLTVTGALTASTGLTATTGNLVVTAGDLRVTAGNSRLGAVSAFATTEPTSALVMKQGTAPVGAITTSGGIFSDGTVVKKIIANGTASNVET